MIKSTKECLARFYQSETRLSLRIIATSLAAGVLATLPLLLFAVFGSADGNPAGLGLVAIVGVLLAQAGLAVGLLRLSWELLIL